MGKIFQAEEDPIAVACRRYGYTLNEIGGHLGYHYSTVSRRLIRSERSACMRDLTPQISITICGERMVGRWHGVNRSGFHAGCLV